MVSVIVKPRWYDTGGALQLYQRGEGKEANRTIRTAALPLLFLSIYNILKMYMLSGLKNNPTGWFPLIIYKAIPGGKQRGTNNITFVKFE